MSTQRRFSTSNGTHHRTHSHAHTRTHSYSSFPHPTDPPSLFTSIWNAMSSILSLFIAICVTITTWIQHSTRISVLESRLSKMWHYTEFFLNLSWALTLELFFYVIPSLKPCHLPTRCVSTSSSWRNIASTSGSTPSASHLFEQENDIRTSHEHHENIFYPIIRKRKKKFTLILDLDETLVHTTDKQVPRFDCRVEIHSKKLSRHFYILKRPYLDLFLSTMSRYFELVVFTASIRRYADAVIDLIDVDCVVERRFFRQACTRREGGQFVKDLSKVSRDLSKTIIIDNSPVAYSINQENAIPIETWYDDPNDTELLDLIPFLIALRSMDDVRSLLRLRTQPHRALMLPVQGITVKQRP